MVDGAWGYSGAFVIIVPVVQVGWLGSTIIHRAVQAYCIANALEINDNGIEKG